MYSSVVRILTAAFVVFCQTQTSEMEAAQLMLGKDTFTLVYLLSAFTFTVMWARWLFHSYVKFCTIPVYCNIASTLPYIPASFFFCIFFVSYTGMTHSQQRESLTLFEGAPLIVSHNSKHSSYHNHTSSNSSRNLYSHSSHNGDGYTDDGAGVAMDDSLLVLDRLREVAQKAVQLEVLYPL